MECRKCKSYFPTYIKIGGKTKNLSKRKYCLVCSPWGKHNTRSFEHITVKKMERSCIICGKLYSYKGLKCHTCKSRIKRHSIKNDAINYLGGKCSFCNYNKCPAAMVFHHLNADEKDFQIGNSPTQSWDKIIKELDKCILLCTNCHHELHYNKHNENRIDRLNNSIKK